MKPTSDSENIEIKIIEFSKDNSYVRGNSIFRSVNPNYEVAVLGAAVKNKTNSDIIVGMAPETIDPLDNKTVLKPITIDFCCSWLDKTLSSWRVIFFIESLPSFEDFKLESNDLVIRNFIFIYPKRKNPISFTFKHKYLTEPEYKSFDVKVNSN
ncbi:hypothetical protein LPTSP4_09740 [Leptospira ryugenii]|uniref:Uncharacterized protein n=1 Tax=Leptospira ryugenii TaxID=1917863 RepID=A0A2P2DXV3_9LEPT|nr:hypothetical protein [Leptospira ryugenii]GBF49461.1 hypothetical protein LPTSP4_09740 [Leptospira ryugenii]